MSSPFIIENSGIYKLINKTNGKYYPGSSKHLLKQKGHPGRKREHFYMLENNNHHCPHLQNAYNKDIREGKLDNYEFVIIQNNIPEDQLLVEEQKLLDYARDFEPEMCYTYNYIASKPPTHYGKNNCNFGKFGKLNHNFGKPLSLERRRKIGNAQKGEKNHRFGKTNSEKTRKLISEANSREKHWNYGKHYSLETKLKQSKARKGKFAGENNPRFISIIYTFKNTLTNEIFEGTQYNFGIKYNFKSIQVSRLKNKQRKSYKNWILIQNIIDYQI